MNGIQKVIKIFAICLAVFIIANIVMLIFTGLSFVTHFEADANNTPVKEFSQEYENINQLEIDLVSSNIEIRSGDRLKVESVAKNELAIKQINGKLTIEENKKWFMNSNLSGDIIVYIPETIKLKELVLDTGAGEIKIENIQADQLELDQGAGILKIINSKFNKTDIDGGAGKIAVISSELNNLDLDCGAGKVELQGNVTGDSKISAGIGQIDISLLGEEEEYQITAEKGIGSIKINNKECTSNTTYGMGNNKLQIDGGIGAIYIQYQSEK